jgi:hypothetical protein
LISSGSLITILVIALVAAGLDLALVLIWRKRREQSNPETALLKPASVPASRWFSNVFPFALALVLHLATRFIGISQYPIYFHGDEAVHTVYASDLIRDGGVFENKTFLPTYFKNGVKYNLSLSVYIQILPTLLFGKSILVTRAVSILLTLIPAAAVAFIIRDFLKLPYGWTATLLLSLVPAWFLHSRTAFETVLSVSMYGGFLYYYLHYRLENPKSLHVALIFGALMFYAYSPAQLIIVACGLILLLADWRYHLKHWRTGMRGLILLTILALPYLRFRLSVSEPIEEHLRDLGSYWLKPIPLTEKVHQFFSIYAYGLSPGYWYFPNGQDLPRHQMGAYGNILSITLPFALLGLVKALISFKLPRSYEDIRKLESAQTLLTYRTILIALFIAPLPGTLAQIGITRVLSFVLPITILTAVGLITVLRWLGKWISPRLLGTGAFTLLAGGLLLLTRDAIVNGPFWHKEYGFGGMQYGAQQVIDEIEHYLETYNNVHIILSTDWANGSDVLARFLLEDPFAVEMAGIESFLTKKRDLFPYYVLVLTPEEYEKALAANKFKSVQVEKTIPYPNGEPGFYFVRLAYTDNIDAIFSQEEAERFKPLYGSIQFDGMAIPVEYPRLDMGSIQNAFDGREETLIRTERINPAVIELTFPVLREVRGVAIHVGASIIRLTVQVIPESGAEPVEFSQEARTTIDTPVTELDFGQVILARTIRLEVLLLENTDFAHVHIWEIWLR